jgi:hypothetical protein
MVPPENTALPDLHFTTAQNTEREGYRTRFEKDAAVNWVHARARPQSGYGAWRIVAVPKIGPNHAPGELHPLFIATSSVISFVAAVKLVQVKRSELTPELKTFIDRAIVPALVKAYLADRGEG